jgi:hypothetical protein
MNTATVTPSNIHVATLMLSDLFSSAGMTGCAGDDAGKSMSW